MKKQFLLPLLAVVLAVSGAVASNNFAPVFYYANDSSCEGDENPTQPCPIGNGDFCVEEGTDAQFYYRPSELSACQALKKP